MRSLRLMAAERRRRSLAVSAGCWYSKACRSRLRNPFSMNSPWLIALSNAWSAPQGCRARTRRPFHWMGCCMAAVHGGCAFLPCAAVTPPRQCVRETVVDGLRDLRPPVHIGDTFAQGTPLQVVFRSALLGPQGDRKSTRLNSSHLVISYAVFCLKQD